MGPPELPISCSHIRSHIRHLAIVSDIFSTPQNHAVLISVYMLITVDLEAPGVPPSREEIEQRGGVLNSSEGWRPAGEVGALPQPPNCPYSWSTCTHTYVYMYIHIIVISYLVYIYIHIEREREWEFHAASLGRF